MSPAADNASAVQSSAPLLSRRRGSLSLDNNSTHGGAPAAVTASTGVADIEQGGGGGASDSMVSVRVKTAGDGREYKVSTSLTATVAEFKVEVSRVIGAEGKYLRLIAAGKMLNPDESVVKEFGLSENCYVHCVVTAAPPRLHLPSLTPVEQAEEEEGEDDDPSTRRGFDSLRGNGMTRGEVTAIRGYFSAQVREFAAANPIPEREGETDWDRQLENEDRWMAAQPPTSEFALNVSMARRGNGRGSLGGLDGLSDEEGSAGATRDFMFGFAMGAFLGVLMLLWMWEAQVPRKQKLGILAGVAFRYSVTMVNKAITSQPDGGTGDGD